jgi:hypothetical protein
MDPLAMTEAQWAGIVDDLAMLNGWRVFGVINSTREITRRSGARIRVRNVNPAGVGFPDRVLVRARDRRLIFAELKRDKRAGGGGWAVQSEQAAWLEDLRAVSDRGAAHAYADLPDGHPGLVEVFVWRPSDLERVKEVLR